MQKIKFYLEKYKIVLGIVFITFFVLIVTIFFINNNKKEAVEISVPIKKVKSKKDNKIKVDIKGMVKEPGVYELYDSERVWDIIEKAGGLLEGANTEYINLSKKLKDEMVIIIYSNDEVDKFKKEDENKIYIKYECECIDNINDACITDKDTVNTNGVKSKASNNSISDGLISINTADKEELMQLSGIGESKALSIIEYREKNGLFKKIEDIMNVSGIGESAYSKIKDSIKL